MAKKKKSAPQAEGSWLDTYADLVTLLLCFFVLLFSSATIEESKWLQLLESFQGKPTDTPTQVVVPPTDPGEEPGGNQGPELAIDFSDLAQLIEEAISEAGVSDSVSVQASDDKSMIFIRFENDLLFDGNSSVLKPAAREFLDVIGDSFVEYNEEIAMIRVNGHTAKVSSTGGRYISDRLLSSDRANAVLMYLEDVKLVEPRKLVSMGYGGNYPIATNDNEEGRAQNRRVEILVLGRTQDGSGDAYLQQILSGEVDLSLYDEVYDVLNTLPEKDISSGESGDYKDYIDRIELDDIKGS